MAALVALDGTLIPQCTASTPQRSDTPPIKQETHGPNSPAVTGVQGDVTIIYGISEEKFESLVSELGVTRVALKSFFNILEQQQVPLENLDSTLRDIAKRYKDLQGQLQALTSDDPAAEALKQSASIALDTGDFAQAERLLNEANQKDLERVQRLQGTIQHLQEERTKSLLSAAASTAALGALKETQLRYAEAATYYHQAVGLVESIPKGPEAILAIHLNDWAGALWRAGDYSIAEPPLERALAIREQVLGPAHVDVAETVNALGELYYLQGRYTEAEPLYHRALAIREKALGPEHPRVAESLTNLGTLYLTQWRHSKAEPLYQRALAIREKILGPELRHGDEPQQSGVVLQSTGAVCPGRTALPAGLDPSGEGAGARASAYRDQPQQPGQVLPGAGPLCRGRAVLRARLGHLGEGLGARPSAGRDRSGELCRTARSDQSHSRS